MDDDYYSLNAILADNHKLACTFELDVPGLGYLEGGTEPDLPAGAKVELPLWLAQTLFHNGLVTFTLPTPYSARVKAALRASAPALRLSSLVGANGWWYRFGRRIADLHEEERDAQLAMLREAFSNRLPPLQDLAAHHASSDHSIPEGGAGTGEAFKEGMEGDERELWAIGQDSGRAVKAWYDSSWGRRRGGR
ncbi:DNA replication protein [Cryptotrichosporon argae]